MTDMLKRIAVKAIDSILIVVAFEALNYGYVFATTMIERRLKTIKANQDGSRGL